ncbi:MAG: sugar ABC transporter ATP-binding protein, partial [Ruthenibacterium sp.]
GAKAEIYQIMDSLAKEGKAVVMISSEMPELLGVCDRILVLKEGRILGQVQAKETSQEEIMAMIVNG